MGGGAGTPASSTSVGFGASELEELITDSIAKGVELGIAKSMSAIKARSGTAAAART